MSAGRDKVAFENWKTEKCSYGRGKSSYATRGQEIDMAASPLEPPRRSGDGC